MLAMRTAFTSPGNATTFSPCDTRVARVHDDMSMSMIDDLANDILASRGDASHCNAVMQILIDIAAYKQAPDTARYAERHLLALYGDPDMPKSSREDLIQRLTHVYWRLLPDSERNNPALFGMPVSLLHLAGQVSHAHNTVGEASDHACPVNITPAGMEHVNAMLESATAIAEPRKPLENICNPGRFITSDEMNACFSHIACARPSVINLTTGTGQAAVYQEHCASLELEALLAAFSRNDASPIRLAPLFVDDHFMLMVVEMPLVPGAGCHVTIVNTHQPDDQVDARRNDPAFPRKYADVIRRRLSARPFPGITDITMLSAPLQKNAINSCGPLVALLAERIEASRTEKDFSVGATIRQSFVRWHALEAQQQRNLVMAQRSRMIGDAAEALNWYGSRFLTPA